MKKENRIKVLTNKAYWEEALELAEYNNLSDEDIAEDIVEKILEVTEAVGQEAGENLDYLPSDEELQTGGEDYASQHYKESENPLSEWWIEAEAFVNGRRAVGNYVLNKKKDKEGHVTVDEFISSGYKAPLFREILEGTSTNTELKVDIVSSISVARDILPEEEWVELVENIKYLINEDDDN